jgi:hypothetical protein
MKNYFIFVMLFFSAVFSNICAEDSLVSILYVDDEFFEAKGVYYNWRQSEVPYSIETRQLFKMTNEKKNYTGTNSYYLTMTLTSLINNKSCDFSSLVMTDDNIHTSIAKVKNQSSYIVEGTYPLPRSSSSVHHMTYHPCWDVYAEHEVELDDGTVYLMILRIREYTFDDAKHKLKTFPVIQSGDQILLGYETVFNKNQEVLDLKNCLYDDSKIYHNNEEIQIDQVIVMGYKKTLKRYSVCHITNNHFKLRDHYFYFDPHKIDFPLDDNKTLVVASEEVEHLSNHSYRLTIGIISPTTNKIHYFKSILLNDKENAEIDKIENYKRYVSSLGKGSNIIWIIRHDLEVILKDGSSYKVRTYIKKTGKKEAVDCVNDVLIQESDQIFWGPEVAFDWHNIDVKNICFRYAKICRDGKKIPFDWLEINGDLRHSQVVSLHEG